MRRLVPPLVLLALSAPAVAQGAGAAPARPAKPGAAAEMAQKMSDPATAERLARVMQALGKAILDLPVGEIAAAAEGRAPSAADKKLTVRDAGRRDDPDFERKFAEQMARSKPLVEQSLKALGSALPAMMTGLKQAGEAVERAAANMPDPTYPKR